LFPSLTAAASPPTLITGLSVAGTARPISVLGESLVKQSFAGAESETRSRLSHAFSFATKLYRKDQAFRQARKSGAPFLPRLIGDKRRRRKRRLVRLGNKTYQSGREAEPQRSALSCKMRPSMSPTRTPSAAV